MLRPNISNRPSELTSEATTTTRALEALMQFTNPSIAPTALSQGTMPSSTLVTSSSPERKAAFISPRGPHAATLLTSSFSSSVFSRKLSLSSGNSKPKLFITSQLPGNAIEILNPYFTVTINPHDRVLSKSELIEALKHQDAVLCTLRDQIDREVLAHAPRLKWISSYNVGINNIDVKEATRLGIAVSYMSDISSESTADQAFALLLATARGVVKADRFVREGSFKGWTPNLLLGTEFHGKTLGIVGMGNIGQAVARRALGFRMNIIYTANSDKKFPGATLVSLDRCLREADFISLHVPLTPATHHLIGQRELSLMKSTAFLVNTARGPIIDEKALVRALSNGKIAGAGLDVFHDEPSLTKGLTSFDNVVLTPHLGSSTLEARTEMSKYAAENLIAHLQGRYPHAIANPEVLQSKDIGNRGLRARL